MTTHERLIELVPDIVALKPGCVMHLSYSPKADAYYRKFEGTRLFRLSYNEKRWECTQGWIDVIEVDRMLKDGDCEILGRDITLADVLLAMNLTGHAFEGIKVIADTMHFDFPTGEEIHFIDPDNGTPGTNYEWGHAEWDLKLPFHLQPQETQDFIGRIIGAEV